MLFMVWVGACWPFVWVMAVGVGVSGFWWRVFQCFVAVVPLSRRVPGVLVGFGVWVVCSGVAGVGVGAFWWFRMLMCVRLSFLVLSLLVCLVNNGLLCVVGAGGCFCGWRWGVVCGCGCVFFVCGVRVRLVGESGWLVLFVGCGGWCALGGLLGCCFLLFVFARCEWCGWRVFVGCECVCVACVVGVVVWVLGVLSGVAGCLCGLVVRLLRVVWVWGLVLGCGRLCSVVWVFLCLGLRLLVFRPLMCLGLVPRPRPRL